MAPATIRIAAALIDDPDGRMLLVRKAGTAHFMQAGGKIEAGEDARAALRRELREEIGLDLRDDEGRYLGRFSAMAAHEPGHIVEADLFHIRTTHRPRLSGEIVEAMWVHADDALSLPLTRDHILPLSRSL